MIVHSCIFSQILIYLSANLSMLIIFEKKKKDSLKLSSKRNSNEPSRISNSQVNQVVEEEGTLETGIYYVKPTTIIISTNYRGIELVTSVTRSVWTRVTHAIIDAARKPCNSTFDFFANINRSTYRFESTILFGVPATRFAALIGLTKDI